MKLLTAFLLSIFCLPVIYGQQIMEASKPMSQGDNNAIVVTLPDTEEKVVAKEWGDFIKEYKGKLRKIKKSSEIFADDAKIEAMSSNTVDVYALVSQRGDNTELTAWFDLGGAYLNSETHPDKWGVAQAMMNDFSARVSKTYVANMLQEEEKKLKGLEGDVKSLEKDKEQALKEIEKCEKKIEEAKAAIEEAENKKEQAMKDVEAQKMVVKEVKKKLNN